MKYRLRLSTLAVPVVLGMVVYACSQSTVQSTSSLRGEGAILPDGSTFTRVSLLDSFAQCILSDIEEFQARSQAFKRLADRAQDDPSDDHLDGLREAWHSAMEVWQRLEVMQLGPAEPTTRPAGQGIRNTIYPWPHRDHCEIDRHLANETYAGGQSDISPEAKSLWAAEYLLFSSTSENACAEDEALNADGAWAELDAETLSVRRLRYTAFVAGVVAEAATQLFNMWSPEGDDFLGELIQAGNGSRTYGRQRVALNAVSDALGYIEWGIKDHKLARPLGLIECDEDDCTEYLEARHSRRSKMNLENNLDGFRRLFNGCGSQYAGLGFDDYLYAMGEPELSEEINDAAQAVSDAIAAIEEPDLVSALGTDLESVRSVHSAFASLSKLLRQDFLVVLKLELPQMVQGDND